MRLLGKLVDMREDELRSKIQVNKMQVRRLMMRVIPGRAPSFALSGHPVDPQ